jgi:hypothetical protein
VVAGSNPAVPTFRGLVTGPRRQRTHERPEGFLETVYLMLGVIGFLVIIAAFFFGGFVILDFLFSRSEGDQ